MHAAAQAASKESTAAKPPAWARFRPATVPKAWSGRGPKHSAGSEDSLLVDRTAEAWHHLCSRRMYRWERRLANPARRLRRRPPGKKKNTRSRAIRVGRGLPVFKG